MCSPLSLLQRVSFPGYCACIDLTCKGFQAQLIAYVQGVDYNVLHGNLDESTTDSGTNFMFSLDDLRDPDYVR